MSRFYGVLNGGRQDVSRCGHSHIDTTAASWSGAIRAHLYVGQDGEEYACIEVTPWHGRGVNKTIFEGKASELFSK